MRREPFYDIDRNAYLFPNQLPQSEGRNYPEEEVRQWCAHELLRAYGIKITDIQFEYPVKVGSKKYSIDILVLHGKKPTAVVECKLRGHTKHAEAMAQTVSYADAQSIRAEFAVYTNGDVWHVRRRVREQWVPLPDLPVAIDQNGTEPLTELLHAITDLNPLLYKLGEQLPGIDAWAFLSAMQRFFCATNLLTQDVDGDLRFAMDNLLRALWAAEDLPYRKGKLNTAQVSFEQYRKRADLGFEILPSRDSIWAQIHQLHVALMTIVDGTHGIPIGDLLVLRLATALTDYGRLLRTVKEPKSYPPLGPAVNDPLRDYISYAVKVHLNASLPDPLDKIWNGDIRAYASPGWKQHLQEP